MTNVRKEITKQKYFKSNN